jgi:hypothetical protein
MPQTGKCPNYAGCLLALRNEKLTLPDGADFICPECRQPLVPAPAGRPIAIPVFILGGICMLVIMAAVAVYIEVLHMKDVQPAGQIGTSFEQAQIAAEHGEFLPSRHMIVASPSPAATGTGQPQ